MSGKMNLVFLSLIVLSMSACEQNYGLAVSGSDGSGSGGTGTSGEGGKVPITNPSCIPFGATSAPLRIMFMVDDSGSTTGTDPKDTERVATVNTFLANYGSVTNLSFSYGAFADSAVSYNMISTGGSFVSSPANPFGNASELSSALTAFTSLTTGRCSGISCLFGGSSSGIGSNTVYTSGFDLLQSQILADQKANSSMYKYQVIFMSDGQPTDFGSSPTSELNGITSMVNSFISAVGANQVAISSVYFGPTDSTAEANLQTMAALGKGQFVNTNLSTSVSIADLVNVPGCRSN